MLKKLLPGVLALAMVAGVNANDVEKKEKEEEKVVSFVVSAKELGFSNEEIVKAFEAAVANADENGVTTLSLTLNNEQKKMALIVGGVAVAALVGVLGYVYRDGKVPFGALWKSAPAATTPAATPAATAPAATAPAATAPAATAPAATAPAATAPAATAPAATAPAATAPAATAPAATAPAATA